MCVCLYMCLCSIMSNSLWPPWTLAYQTPLAWDFSDKNTGVGCHFLLQVKEVLILLLLLFSHQVSDSLHPMHARLMCSSLSPWVCSDSCPLSWWCHPTISSSVVLFSSCPQSFPASGSFPVSQLFISAGTNIGASVSALDLLKDIQGWFPLGLTGLMSLLSKGLSRVFSSTMIWKHQFFGAQSSLWSNSHIHTWLLEKPQLWLYGSWLTRQWCLSF